MTNLQVVTWPVEKLIPFVRNARTHSDEQVAQIAASIAEFGWTNPILAGADGIVIAHEVGGRRGTDDRNVSQVFAFGVGECPALLSLNKNAAHEEI